MRQSSKYTHSKLNRLENEERPAHVAGFFISGVLIISSTPPLKSLNFHLINNL